MKLLCSCGKELVARKHDNGEDIIIEPCWGCHKNTFNRGQDGERYEGQRETAHMRGEGMGR